jgi:tetratricopeptide (TPR) repeat protein
MSDTTCSHSKGLIVMSATSASYPKLTEVAALDQIVFLSTLPNFSNLPAQTRSLVREADANIKADHLESALELSLSVNASEPEYVPGYLRTVELLIATRRRDAARDLLRTIRKLEDLADRTTFSLEIERIQAHVDPDTEKAHNLALEILQGGANHPYTPYVPAAIERLSQNEHADDALDLARSWVEKQPDSPVALCYLVRCHLERGDGPSASAVLRRFREQFDADRIWPENIVASALVAVASEGIDPKWMAVGPVCSVLRTASIDYERVTDILEFLVPAIQSPQRALLFAGLLAVNANDFKEANGLFQTTPAETPIEHFLRNVGLERSSQSQEDSRERFSLLREIWQCLRDAQVIRIAESGEIFDPPASRATIGLAIVESLQENQAYEDALRFVEELIRRGLDDTRILRLRAELLGKAGSRDDALTALDQLVSRQESAHQYTPAIETLESMIRLVPGNIRLRARIVDNCLKVGAFDKAIEQLVMQGRLLHKAGRLTEAEAPIHRAIEIATMTSDWEKVHKLHRLLISFDPEETRLRHAAVTTYVQHGRTQEAMDQLREIVRIARKRNEMDEAIGASHQMLALDPEDHATYHQLGELLVAIQEYHQADRVYRRLARLAPDDRAVKAKRSAIAALTKARQTTK